MAVQASATWDKFRKERDFHRMHHKRVAQEKNKLIHDMQILKKHYSMVWLATFHSTVCFAKPIALILLTKTVTTSVECFVASGQHRSTVVVHCHYIACCTYRPALNRLSFKNAQETTLQM